jgi:hypothetical protein
MERIQVGYREILPGTYHQYILYTDSSGHQEAGKGVKYHIAGCDSHFSLCTKLIC